MCQHIVPVLDLNADHIPQDGKKKAWSPGHLKKNSDEKLFFFFGLRFKISYLCG